MILLGACMLVAGVSTALFGTLCYRRGRKRGRREGEREMFAILMSAESSLTVLQSLMAEARADAEQLAPKDRPS